MRQVVFIALLSGSALVIGQTASRPAAAAASAVTSGNPQKSESAKAPEGTATAPASQPAEPKEKTPAAPAAATLPPAKGAASSKTNKPEALHYAINWPSGLSFGEALISSSRATLQTGPGWTYTLKIDASVPGYKLQENANSTSSAEYCAIELTKESLRGKKKVQEKTTFDAHNLTATRETLNGGGKSELTIPACAKDALSYVFFLRNSLANGRLPGPQKVYFGSAYEVRPEYVGTQSIRLNGESVEADRILGHIKGPKTTLTVEMFLSKDADREPLMIRIPVAQGKLSVELVR